MMTRSKKHTYGVAAFLGLLVCSMTNPAKADSTSAEIRLLKARLKLLEAKVTQQERTAKSERQGRAAKPALASARTAAVVITGPEHFFFKGLEITPGGFFAAESVYRSHWMGADNNTPFQNIPFDFIPGAHQSEWRATARPSRPSLMIKADIDRQTHIMAFGEVDFLGAAQTANSNQSNSYNLRMRQAYGNVDFDEYGVHVAAGQMWSLVTMNSAGIRPDTSLQPLTIDHQYLPGYVWARTPGFRITKDFNKQLWAAFSIESSSATYVVPGPTAFGTTALPLIGAPALLAPPAAGGLFNAANPYPFTRMPDMIGKVAWDGELAERKVHVEGFGLLRDVTDRAYWGNHSQWGGGGGGGVVVQLMPKLLDFQFSGMIGNGIGNYGAGQLPVATYQLSGAPQLISERLAMAGLILHPTPQTEVYGFAGGEFSGKHPQWAAVGSTLFVGGYGNPFYNNTTCGLENDASNPTAPGVAANVAIGGLCAGQTKSLRQLTGGIWHTLYQGPFGRIRAGAQYSYTVRDGFAGFGGTPRGTENMVYTSLRYYPFDGPAAAAPAITK
jgi:hypothetical protein